jgi:uncharacterized protein YecT (DUF1311 family)
MPSFRASSRKLKVSYVLGFAALFLIPTGILLPNAAGHGSANAQESGPPPQSPEPRPLEPPPQQPPAAVSKYDKAIFLKPIPSDQLAFLNQVVGKLSGDAVRDKQFRKLMKSVIPNPMFHYGWDMPLADALDMVLKGSPQPVQIRDGRYVIVSGRSGPYLAGRGFIWIDMHDGVALGGFYFHPTNGEPTPSVTVFSRQVKEEFIGLSQLPPAFADDLSRWSRELSVPLVTTRYFIGDISRKILLEHDEDYCAPLDEATAPPENDCEQMNADAADVDMNAASYLDQTHYATNATAWMITDPDQISWIQVRDNTCRVGPDPLGCHIRMTRERTHVIIRRNPMPHLPHR